MIVRFLLLLLTLLFFNSCSPQNFFYYPNRTLYADPAAMKIPYETIQYTSLNGKKLWALYFPTDQSPKGTVVHFHGNFGNVSNHFPLSMFLVKNGFDVIAFDYQGYGASEGHPSPKKIVEDGIATVRYAQAHLRNPQTGVVVFGQSLGGAVGVVTTAKEPMVKAAVIEAAFTSYSTMAKVALRRSAWTWVFSWIAPIFLSDRYNAVDYVQHIAPRPVLFIHGDQDQVVPFTMSQTLFEKAREPKRLWIIEGAGHLEGRRAGEKYNKTVVDFFTQALSTSTAKN
jgi:fermentation-respiration switch protein FrsA (DUF1100 family)